MAHVVINDTTPRATFAVGATPTSGPFVLTADFVVFDPSTDIEVFNGTTLLTYSATPVGATQWSFTGTLIDGGYQGGSISLGGTVSNTTIVVNRKVKIARSNDFPYPSATLDIKGLNTALDKLFAIEQDTKLRNQFALSQPSSDTAIIGKLPAKSVRASNFLGFDAAGDPTSLTAVGTAPAVASTYLKRNAGNTAFDAKTPGEVATDIGISAYGATLVDDVDAKTARTTLAALTHASRSISGGGTATVTTADAGKVLLVDSTAGATTLAFDPAATLGAGFVVVVKKADTTSNQVILDPSGAELIDDLTTLTLPLPEDVAMIYCDGVKLHALDIARNWFIRSHRTNTAGAYTVNTFDNGYTTRNDATAGGITVNLPASSAVSKAYRGFTHVVQKVDNTSNVVTIDPDLAETIDKALTKKLYMQSDSVLLYNDSNEWWVIAESLKPVGFRAHKAGVNQTGLASATWVKITWPNANWNDAGLFDTAISKWTPPAGRVRLHANLQFAATNLVDQNIVGVSIYKNGVGIAFHQVHVSGIAQGLSVAVTAEDEPNGTDFYEVYGYKGGAGTGDVVGVENNSWFMGEVLKR